MEFRVDPFVLRVFVPVVRKEAAWVNTNHGVLMVHFQRLNEELCACEIIQQGHVEINCSPPDHVVVFQPLATLVWQVDAEVDLAVSDRIYSAEPRLRFLVWAWTRGPVNNRALEAIRLEERTSGLGGVQVVPKFLQLIGRVDELVPVLLLQADHDRLVGQLESGR